MTASAGDSIDVTFMVACFNEAENIEACLDGLIDTMRQSDLTYEVIVTDDASTDDSVGVIERWMSAHPDADVRLVRNEKNRGLAQSYIEGAFRGRGEYYRLICGDIVEPAETILAILSRAGEADMVIPYPVEIVGKSLFRRRLSNLYTNLINGVNGYRDIRYYNGLALHRRYNVMRWHTNYHGFGFQADMISRLLDEGCTYVQVPVKAVEREVGESTALSRRNILSVAHTFVDLAIRRVARSKLL